MTTPAQQIQLAAQLWRRGFSFSAIARHIGTHRTTVYAWHHQGLLATAAEPAPAGDGGWWCPDCIFRGYDRAALAQHREQRRCGR